MLKSICTSRVIYSFSIFQCFCSSVLDWFGFVGAADIVVVVALFLSNGQKRCLKTLWKRKDEKKAKKISKRVNTYARWKKKGANKEMKMNE